MGYDGGQPNLYAYCNNGPVGNNDPMGLDAGWTHVPGEGPFGPDPSIDNPGLLPPDENGNERLPPNYHSGWPSGRFPKGKPYVQDPDTGIKYLPHPEDGEHWPHYDLQPPGGGKNIGEFPSHSVKLRPNQKRPPYGRQSPDDPWKRIPGRSPSGEVGPDGDPIGCADGDDGLGGEVVGE
jgi:hypothetical protein